MLRRQAGEMFQAVSDVESLVHRVVNDFTDGGVRAHDLRISANSLDERWFVADVKATFVLRSNIYSKSERTK